MIFFSVLVLLLCAGSNPVESSTIRVGEEEPERPLFTLTENSLNATPVVFFGDLRRNSDDVTPVVFFGALRVLGTPLEQERVPKVEELWEEQTNQMRAELRADVQEHATQMVGELAAGLRTILHQGFLHELRNTVQKAEEQYQEFVRNTAEQALAEIQEKNTELQALRTELQAEQNTELQALRAELQEQNTELQALRAELQAEQNTELQALRAELQEQNTELQAQRAELRELQAKGMKTAFYVRSWGPGRTTEVFTNLGNHFNVSTGAFTAPTAGHYIFNTFYDVHGPFVSISMGVVVNGHTRCRADGPMSGYFQASCTAVVELNAGDVVEVEVEARSAKPIVFSNNDKFDHGFSGFLYAVE